MVDRLDDSFLLQEEEQPTGRADSTFLDDAFLLEEEAAPAPAPEEKPYELSRPAEVGRAFVRGANVQGRMMAGGAAELAGRAVEQPALTPEEEAEQRRQAALQEVPKDITQARAEQRRDYAGAVSFRPPNEEGILNMARLSRGVKDTVRLLMQEADAIVPDFMKTGAAANWAADEKDSVQRVEKFAEAMQKWGKKTQISGQEWLEDNIGWAPSKAYTEKSFRENLYLDPIRAIGSVSAENAPNMIATIGAYVVGGPALGLGTGFALESADSFTSNKEYLAKKYGGEDNIPPVEWARLVDVATSVGAANSVLELLPVTKAFERAGLGKQFSNNVINEIAKRPKLMMSLRKVTVDTGKGTATEMPTELVQEIVQIAGDITLGQNPGIDENIDRMLQATLAAGPTGAIMGGGTSTIGEISRVKEQRKFAAAYEEHERKMRETAANKPAEPETIPDAAPVDEYQAAYESMAADIAAAPAAPGAVPSTFDQKGQPAELFNPTHIDASGQPVQRVTKDGQPIPDTYMRADGTIFRDTQVQANPDAVDPSMDVNVVAATIKAEVMGPSAEVAIPEPVTPPVAELPAAEPITPIEPAPAPEAVTRPQEPAPAPESEQRAAQIAAELTPEQIQAEIDQVSAAARERMDELREGKRAAYEAETELDFMAPEERARLDDLKRALPSYGAEAEAAKERLKKRAAERKPFGKPKTEIDKAAVEAATSPTNELPAPTEAQKEAGNYKKGHATVQGLDIAIENPAGSKRRPEWPTLKQHYGYIKRTVGADSEPGAKPHEIEQVDVFVKPGEEIPADNPIFVIDQYDASGKKFDEHKVMMGFATEQEARDAYMANYTQGWKGLKQITQATPEEFKAWLETGDSTKEYGAIVPRETIKAEGKESTVTTSVGTKISTKFTVVDMDSLIPSNDDAGNKNPAYPEALQPRDRSRGASQVQIKKIASKLDPVLLGDSVKASDGAPIIGDDGVVESGNARVLGVRLAYKTGKASAYRQHLIDNAAAYGLTAADMEAVKNPVLVRVRQGELSMKERAELARQANQPDIAPMSPVEQAKSDADRITDEDMKLYAPSEQGNILAPSNQSFLQGFAKKLGDLEAGGLTTADGRWTKQMADRVQAAIFYKAYGDERLLTLTAEEADPDIKNILSALNTAAPAFARARAVKENLGDLDIINDIVGGIDVIRQAKADGTSVRQIVDQGGLFGDVDPVVAKMAEFIESSARSSKRMGVGFMEMAKFLEKELVNIHQESLFDLPPATKADIVVAANKRITEVYGDEKRIPDLFSKEQVGPADSQRAAETSHSVRQQGEDAGTEAKTAVTGWKKTAGGKYIGYKVMRLDGKSVVSGADSRLRFRNKAGQVISMTGEGVFLSNDQKYVTDYYSGLADNEVLLRLEFDKADIVFGKSSFNDREPEIGVRSATILESIPITKEGEPIEVQESKSKYGENVDAFFEEWFENTFNNPFSPRDRIVMNKALQSRDDFAMLDVSPIGKNLIHLSSILSSESGRGNGAAGLKMLIDLADKHGLSIDLTAKAFGREQTLSTKQLKKWYGRHGFEETRGDRMIRKPAQELPVPDLAARPAPEEIKYASMEGKEVSYQVQIESTGEVFTVTVDAAEAMRDLDARTEALAELRKCL